MCWSVSEDGGDGEVWGDEDGLEEAVEEALDFDGIIGEHPLGEMVEEGLDLFEGDEEVLTLDGLALCLRDGVAQVFYFEVYVFDFGLCLFDGVEFGFVGVLDALALSVEFCNLRFVCAGYGSAQCEGCSGRREITQSRLNSRGNEGGEFVVVDDGFAAVEAGVAGLFAAEALAAVGAGE